MPTLPQDGAKHKTTMRDWRAAVEAAMREAVRGAIECVLEEELAELLGPRYIRTPGRMGYRHGSKPRTVTCPVGPLTLAVPRARLTGPLGERMEWASRIVIGNAKIPTYGN